MDPRLGALSAKGIELYVDVDSVRLTYRLLPLSLMPAVVGMALLPFVVLAMLGPWTISSLIGAVAIAVLVQAGVAFHQGIRGCLTVSNAVVKKQILLHGWVLGSTSCQLDLVEKVVVRKRGLGSSVVETVNADGKFFRLFSSSAEDAQLVCDFLRDVHAGREPLVISETIPSALQEVRRRGTDGELDP
mgnify:CR=1